MYNGVLSIGLSEGVTIVGYTDDVILGPILWNTMYNGVLSIGLPEGVTIVGYADDVILVGVAKHFITVGRKCSESKVHK